MVLVLFKLAYDTIWKKESQCILQKSNVISHKKQVLFIFRHKMFLHFQKCKGLADQEYVTICDVCIKTYKNTGIKVPYVVKRFVCT